MMRIILAILGFGTLGVVGAALWLLAAQLVGNLPDELGEAEMRQVRIAAALSVLSLVSMLLSAVCTVGYLWIVNRGRRQNHTVAQDQ